MDNKSKLEELVHAKISEQQFQQLQVVEDFFKFEEHQPLKVQQTLLLMYRGYLNEAEHRNDVDALQMSETFQLVTAMCALVHYLKHPVASEADESPFDFEYLFSQLDAKKNG